MMTFFKRLSLLTIILATGCSLTDDDGASEQLQSATGPAIDLLQEFDEVDGGKVMVVAHRGCWSAAPENSIQSIENCIKLGASWPATYVDRTHAFPRAQSLSAHPLPACTQLYHFRT